MISAQDRSALGIQLDAVELMVARDVNQGRELAALRATLTHIALAVGLAPPADVEGLKKAITALVERTKIVTTDTGTATAPVQNVQHVAHVAREWFAQNPYDDDMKTDEALSYFESFAGRDDASVVPFERELAGMMRNLLVDQGMFPEESVDLVRARILVSNLRNDAAFHRANLGATPELATLRRQLEEAKAEIEQLKAKKGRRR